jgi:Asp-tRNA(Asn)/Glu-tRNA(Gln) amidotransferase A subunit family amidase
MSVVIPSRLTAYSPPTCTTQTNCLTEIFIDRALERAAWLDEQLKSTGKVVGPLHGLPISLKDQISIKGLETTMGACYVAARCADNVFGVLGYVSWIGKVAERDATLTEILIECGAVLYVRTNLPQTLMVGFTSLITYITVYFGDLIVVISGQRPTTWCLVELSTL